MLPPKPRARNPASALLPLLPLLLLLLPSCSSLRLPGSKFNNPNSKAAPAWAARNASPPWWAAYRDPALGKLIPTAYHANPDLATASARLHEAAAREGEARAAAYPSINLGFGLRQGRYRNPGNPVRDYAPFHGSGNLSWELDLNGKLRAARRSAAAARAAAFWDLEAARLLIAAKVADARFRQLRFHEEQEILRQTLASSQGTLKTLRARETAGLATTTDLRRQEAENESLRRALLDLARLQRLAEIEIATLTGARPPKATRLPDPPAVIHQTAFQNHPSLLAAESRIRSAFHTAEAARLDLLPSLSLRASLSGGASSLTNRFKTWAASVGPSLDLPVYDPSRLARLRTRRAQAATAAARYRAAAVQVMGEADAALANLASRRAQLASARRQARALAEAEKNTRATYAAGLVSQIELLEAQRTHLAARRAETALRHKLLQDHLALTKATGG